MLSIPPQARVLTQVFPGLHPYAESLELGRLVLDDEVPANGGNRGSSPRYSGRAALVGVRGIVSFSDPMPRAAADGTTITPGHVGTIYQALNAVYTSRGTERSLIVLPGGSIFSARAAQISCGAGAGMAARSRGECTAGPGRDRPGHWIDSDGPQRPHPDRLRF